MSKWPSFSITDFRGRALPEAGILAGYAALIDTYDLKLPLPHHMVALGERHRPSSNDSWTMLSPRQAPSRRSKVI
ncbi:hypothetical protein [Sphingobium sp. SCG-1]|uniref:hypothetical protein n=1 Tax=Sphingobium sp. SCG-1 TaxID=2072936 RepID=UPI00268A6F60|nr:hypothetical protein [Sphingobium sp. SCG-1]